MTSLNILNVKIDSVKLISIEYIIIDIEYITIGPTKSLLQNDSICKNGSNLCNVHILYTRAKKQVKADTIYIAFGLQPHFNATHEIGKFENIMILIPISIVR